MTKSPITYLKINGVCLVLVATVSLSLCLLTNPTLTSAQTPEKVRNIPAEFVPEAGCPISIVDTRTILDVDPFDAPIDARIYISYKNISDKQIAAAKFRVRFCDTAGQELGTFQAPDSTNLGPSQECTQKWKREPVHPKTVSIKVRVLQVKYGDGSLWESQKMQELVPPPS